MGTRSDNVDKEPFVEGRKNSFISVSRNDFDRLVHAIANDHEYLIVEAAVRLTANAGYG